MEKKSLLIASLLISVIFTGMISGEDEQDVFTDPVIEGDPFRFDFGTRSSPVMESFQTVTSGTLYDGRRGYGLLEPAEEFVVTGRFNEPSPHILQRSWVYGEYADHLTMDGLRSEDMVSFRVDLDNGTYRLILWLGDMEKGVYSMNVSVNDQWMLEGADAFHTVHRSMYFNYQPNPRDPELEFMNYGMAVPYYLAVNVTEGMMVINVTGNDSAYNDLLAEELAKNSPYSYSVWMSTGTKKYSQGTGPWRYIGGPFTNASVLGLEIYPEPDLPVKGEIGSLHVDRDITSAGVHDCVEGLNDGNFLAAYSYWVDSREEDLSGRNRLARSQLGMILAGTIHLDREIDIIPWVLEDLREQDDMREDTAYEEILYWMELTEKGLHYEFNRTAHPGDGEKKNHFLEANKAFILLNMIKEDNPLFPKMNLWAARCLMNLDPHRWTSASETALEMMENLRSLDPDNSYIRMYLDTTRESAATWGIPTPVISTTGVYDNWTLKDYNHGFDEAPSWAKILHEELGWLYDITDWWVDNRMQENGYLGGGWADDVEMIGLFGFDALISEGADEKSLEGAGRFVDGMLRSGQVDMERGYSEAFADVEHTAELTGDSLPMMIAIDFGDPKWVEFSMKTAVLMRGLWMGENEKGLYQFKSNYLSATRVGTGGNAEDSWINFRAALPALWAWWYSNDEEVQDLLVEWADSWVNAALSTEKDKPMGIIPAGIGWPDGEIGGHNSPNWYTAAHPPGSVNYDWAPQKYKSYIVTLLETAYSATGNLTFLEPLRLEAHIAQEFIDDPDPRADPGTRKWAGGILGQNALKTYQSILDKYQLPGGSSSSDLWNPAEALEACENGYQYIRKSYPLMTTEASATDRALFIGVANPFLIFTGGSIGGALLAPQFTYSGLYRDFAAVVRDGNAGSANISMFGFFEETRDVSVIPWSLEIGGEYVLKAGPDLNSDGIMDPVTDMVNFTYLTRGQKVPFELPGNEEYLITITQMMKGTGLRPLMPDPSFDEEDNVVVDKDNGTVTVKVHNIGSEDVEDLKISIFEDLDGGLRYIGKRESIDIPAPSNLQPSIADVDLIIHEEPWIDEVVIIIDPDDDIMEITESNNELRGYWDLEGINITEFDEPIRMNVTIPVIYANEDEPLYDVIDLRDYFWDPDNPELHFFLDQGSMGNSTPWICSTSSLIENRTELSFVPDPIYGRDWSGNITYDGRVHSPGPDMIFDNDDDPPLLNFNITLVVQPVNDDPILEAIMINGTRHNITESGFNFYVDFGDPFMGEIIWSDVDGDAAILGLEEPRGNLMLYNNTLVLPSYEPNEVILAHLNITDGNGSGIQRIPISIHVGEGPQPALLGLSFDGESIDIPYENGRIQVDVNEREEKDFYFIFRDAPDAYVIELDPTTSILGWSNNSRTLIGVNVTGEFEIFEVLMGWFLDLQSDGFEGFILEITVHNVNRAPTGLMVEFNDIYYQDEDVLLLIIEAVDPDGDELKYFIDWGDGGVRISWSPGESASHIYSEPGTYRILVDVTDIWGEDLNVSGTILIKGRPEPDDNTTDTKDNEDNSVLIAILVVVIIIIFIVLIIVIVRPRYEGDDEYYEEEIENDPLKASVLLSFEE